MAVLTVIRNKGESGEQVVDLPTPSEMSVDLQDIDSGNTRRNVKGVIIRDRVRGADSVVRKLECSWSGLTFAEASRIIHAVQDTFFHMSYPDPYTCDIREAEFYVGDRKTKIFHLDEDGSNVIAESLKFNFIEK